MISVIIPTFNAEAGLAQTLAALVPAALDGLVREVIVVDGGSRDRTAAIADDAGATVVLRSGGRGCQLAAGAAEARFPWRSASRSTTTGSGRACWSGWWRCGARCCGCPTATRGC